MRVLMLSKACVVGMYQRKLEELASLVDVELSLVVPPYWRQGKTVLALEKMHTSGYGLYVLPMAFNGHFHVHFYPGLGRLVRDLRPDIMHVDEEPYNLATFQAMFLAQRAGSKAIFFTWQNLLRRYPLPFSLFERYNLRHAAAAISGSQEASRVLRSKGYQGPVHVVPQFGVDPGLHPHRSTARHSRAEFVIGYFGRMVKEKGVHILLRAAAALEGAWRLQLIGDGSYLPTLKALTRQLGIEDRVIFESWKPAGEMPRYYGMLDALVLPSITRPNWKEQFGRVLVEAMASEVPVIGASSGEIPHVIGNAGRVFAEGDVGALREALCELMSNPDLCLELGRRGRLRVLEHYTHRRIAAATYKAYRQVMDPA